MFKVEPGFISQLPAHDWEGGNTRVWPLPNCAGEPHGKLTDTLSSVPKSKALLARLFPTFLHFIGSKFVSWLKAFAAQLGLF